MEKETYVWKQILANRNRWTKAELKESLRDINKYRQEGGLDRVNELAKKIIKADF